MDAYAEGFLKAIEVVGEFLLTTMNEPVNYSGLLGMTKQECKLEGIKNTINRLSECYEKEIKNGIRD